MIQFLYATFGTIIYFIHMKKILLTLFTGFSVLGSAQSWNPQATGFVVLSRGISDIEIVDANTVWGVAFDGSGAGDEVQEFTKTTDGGTTWTPGIIDVGDTLLGINNLSAINSTTAWVSAVNGTTGLGSVIYKTEDGGQNWTQQNPLGYTNGSSFVNYVHFFDANNGISAGDPINGEFEIYRTTNGGATWTLVPGANIPNPTSGEYGYNNGNKAIGNTVWLVTNKGRILKSTDQGVTWTVSQAPVTDFGGTAQSARMDFSSTTNGFMLKTVGTAYTFYTTTDGGTTWSAGTPFTGTYRLLSAVPNTNVIVATGAGTASGGSGSAFSADNGATWTTIDSGNQRGVNAFFNATTGWCGGYNDSSTSGGIFKFSGSLANSSFASSKFKVFPNPATSQVTLSSDSLDSYTVNVMNIEGKTMFTKNFNNLENTMDISSLTPGVYFFEIKSGDRSETIKVIKN